jgi:tetratricopeptide (TPR) repeat protein
LTQNVQGYTFYERFLWASGVPPLYETTGVNFVTPELCLERAHMRIPAWKENLGIVVSRLIQHSETVARSVIDNGLIHYYFNYLLQPYHKGVEDDIYVSIVVIMRCFCTSKKFCMEYAIQHKLIKIIEKIIYHTSWLATYEIFRLLIYLVESPYTNLIIESKVIMNGMIDRFVGNRYLENFLIVLLRLLVEHEGAVTKMLESFGENKAAPFTLCNHTIPEFRLFGEILKKVVLAEFGRYIGDIDLMSPKTYLKPTNLNRAEQLKEEGNKLFKEGNLTGAKEKYTEALSHIPMQIAADLPERNEKLLLVLYSNRALCHLKLGDFDECIRDATRSINKDFSFKAHYRRAKAFASLGRVVEAINDFVSIG